MVLLARKIFYPSWLTSLELRTVSESESSFLEMYSLTRASRLDSQKSVLLKKEFWQFIREPSQWIHMGIISILIISFLISILKVDLKLTLPFLQTVSYMVVFLFNAFLVGSIALRFIFPMISIEGESFWKVLAAPISRAKVYGLKFTVAVVPLVILSLLLTVFSHRPLNDYPVLLYVSMAIMIAISFALVSLNLGAGAFFVNFKEKNPIRAASSQSATLTFLISILYFTFLVSVMFIPYNRFFEYAIKGKAFDPASLLYGTLAVIVISTVMGILSLIVGLRALKRDF
jgi:ABC-2 type transport system permease protein